MNHVSNPNKKEIVYKATAATLAAAVLAACGSSPEDGPTKEEKSVTNTVPTPEADQVSNTNNESNETTSPAPSDQLAETATTTEPTPSDQTTETATTSESSDQTTETGSPTNPDQTEATASPTAEAIPEQTELLELVSMPESLTKEGGVIDTIELAAYAVDDPEMVELANRYPDLIEQLEKHQLTVSTAITPEGIYNAQQQVEDAFDLQFRTIDLEGNFVDEPIGIADITSTETPDHSFYLNNRGLHDSELFLYEHIRSTDGQEGNNTLAAEIVAANIDASTLRIVIDQQEAVQSYFNDHSEKAAERIKAGLPITSTDGNAYDTLKTLVSPMFIDTPANRTNIANRIDGFRNTVGYASGLTEAHLVDFSEVPLLDISGETLATFYTVSVVAEYDDAVDGPETELLTYVLYPNKHLVQSEMDLEKGEFVPTEVVDAESLNFARVDFSALSRVG